LPPERFVQEVAQFDLLGKLGSEEPEEWYNAQLFLLARYFSTGEVRGKRKDKLREVALPLLPDFGQQYAKDALQRLIRYWAIKYPRHE
jgi:hypothetical protein